MSPLEDSNNNSPQKNDEKTVASPAKEEIVGVGMQLDFRKKRVFAIEPVSEGPAAKAGILHEDEILEIDGDITSKLSVEEIVAHIRGPRGSAVVFKILRKGNSAPQLFSLVRDKVQVPEKKSQKIAPPTPKPDEKEVSERIPKPSLSLRGTEKLSLTKPSTSTEALEKKKLEEAPRSLFQETPQTASLKKSPSIEEPEKKSQKIQKSSVQRIKKKTQRLIQALFEEEAESVPTPIAPEPTQIAVESAIKEDSGIIELAPIKEESGIITISPIESFQETEIQSSQLEEQVHPLPSISALEARLASLQDAELKELEEEDEEEEEKKETASSTLSSTAQIENLTETPPQEEVSTSRFKKATQRLKKATQKLQQGARRVVKTFVDYLDEEEKDSKDAQYIAIHDVNKKVFTTPPPPPEPQSPFKTVSERFKKTSQRLKKKTQKMIKIFYEEQVNEVPKPTKEETAIYGTASYWYKADEMAPRKQQKKSILPPLVDKPLEKTPHSKKPPGLKAASKPAKTVVRKNSWEGFELAPKSAGLESESNLIKYFLGVAGFFFFLWSLDLLPKERKTYVKPTNTTQIARTFPQPDKEIKPDTTKNTSNNPANPQEYAERVLQIYKHSRFTEEESLKEILERYGVTLETMSRFPPEKLGDLDKKELTLILDYQYRQRCFLWAKEEIQAYHSFNFENKSALLTKREEFLKRKAGIVPALLSALSEPDLGLLIHQELSLLLGLTEESTAYSAVLLLYEEEIVTEKRGHLLFSLIKIGKAQAVPKVLEILKRKEFKEAGIAKSLFVHFAEKGNEKALEPLLYENDPEVVDLSKAVLLKINTKEAQNILKAAHLAGKIAPISFEVEDQEE